jgi:hypothetical protein
MRADRGNGPAIRLRQPKAALLALRTNGVKVDHRTGPVVLRWWFSGRERCRRFAWGRGQELSGLHR